MLDGASRIGEVVAAAAADGQPAVGITDHGNMYGALELYKAARAAGVKPVLGMEGYFTNTSRFDRPKRSEHEIFHLTMLAETDEGYRNLIKVTSVAYLDGYYYKPRSDWELLERTTRASPRRRAASAGSSRSSSCRATRGAALEAAAARFQDIFGREHFFVELQDHGIDDDAQVIAPAARHRAQARRAAARDQRQPLHAQGTTPKRTTRCCACRPARCRATRTASSSTATTSTSSARPEMRHLFREAPEACDNTLLIAERAEVEIEFGQRDPPVVPGARRARRELVPARAHDRRCEGALRRRPRRCTCSSASTSSSTSSSRWGSPRTSSSSGTSCATRSRAASGSARAGGARPVRASRTACASSTSTRSSTTCCSSGSSTRAASRCPTSTWTSTPGTGAR